MGDMTPEERGDVRAENHHHSWHRFGDLPWDECEECVGLAEEFAQEIRAAEAAAYERAAELVETRRTEAREIAGVEKSEEVRRWWLGIAQEDDLIAYKLRAKAARVRGK